LLPLSFLVQPETACSPLGHCHSRSWPFDGHWTAVRAARANKTTRPPIANPSRSLSLPRSILLCSLPLVVAGGRTGLSRPGLRRRRRAATADAPVELFPTSPSYSFLPSPLFLHLTDATSSSCWPVAICGVVRCRCAFAPEGEPFLSAVAEARCPLHCTVLLPVPRHADAH
jgi:hypothetical protein